MNICLLMSGIIKNYDYIKNIIKLFDDKPDYNLFVFGHTFSFLGNPNLNKENIDYKSSVLINKKLLKNYYTEIKFIKNYDEFDEDGFDNRIYSQWQNVKKALNLATKYSKKHNIDYDIIIKARTDIDINQNELFKHIDCINKTGKVVFGNQSCHILQDQLFLGPTDKMKKILNLVNFYYKYCNKHPWKKIADERKSLLINNEKHLRFGGMSEILLYQHTIKNLKQKEYIIVNKFWNIIRS